MIYIVVLVRLLRADPGSDRTRSIIGVMQSFAAGVMIFMTCFHLIPESTEAIGSHETMIYFFIGVLVFVILDRFIIPEEHEHSEESNEKKKRTSAKKRSNSISKKVNNDFWTLHRTSVITFVAMALHNIPG